MLIKISVFIIYFVTNLLSTDSMTIITHHGNRNRGGQSLRHDQRKIHHGHDPPLETKRRRFQQTMDQAQNIAPISNATPPVDGQSQIDKIEDDITDFLLKNSLLLADELQTVPSHSPRQRLEVTVKPLVMPTEKATPTQVTAVGHRQNPALSVGLPRLRASEEPKGALPYDVVENLVLSLKKNGNSDIPFIVKDLKNKLDEVVEKNVPEARAKKVTTTKKPKKQNIMKEMDKIMDEFLRTSANGTSSDSSSGEPELPLPPRPGPVMRTHGDGEDDDLEFDLEGDDAPTLRFNLKEK